MHARASHLHHELAQAARSLWLADGAAPGTPLREAELARRLSVSRTPVRAALRLLEGAGIAQRAGRGLVLADPERPLPPPDAAPEEALLRAVLRARNEGALEESVTESALARRLGAPRGLVARAMARLAELGVVEANPAQGWRFLSGPGSPADRVRALRFRLALEPAALREPGYRLDAGFAREMRAAHAAVLARPWHDAQALDFFRMNAAFHVGLAAGSGNRFFVQAVEAQNRLRALRNLDWRFGAARAYASCQEHLAVLDALEEGRPEEAARLLVAHLESAGP